MLLLSSRCCAAQCSLRAPPSSSGGFEDVFLSCDRPQRGGQGQAQEEGGAHTFRKPFLNDRMGIVFSYSMPELVIASQDFSLRNYIFVLALKVFYSHRRYHSNKQDLGYNMLTI